jgi:hypothetical protein
MQSIEEYTPFEWPFEPKHRLAGIVNELPKGEARKLYRRVMDRRTEALSEIRKISDLSNLTLPLEHSQLEHLNHWYCSGVEPSEDLFDLCPDWYSIALDLGLILGDSLITQREHLHWAFCQVVETSISFQMPVLQGFRNVDNPNFYKDIITDVIAIGRKELIIRNPKLKLSQAENPIQKNTIDRQVETILETARDIRKISFRRMIENCLDLV